MMRINEINNIDVLRCEPAGSGTGIPVKFVIDCLGEDDNNNEDSVSISMWHEDALSLRNQLNEFFGIPRTTIFDKYTALERDNYINITNGKCQEVNIGKDVIKELYEDYLKEDGEKAPIDLDISTIESMEKRSGANFVTVKTKNGDVMRININTIKKMFKDYCLED